MGQKPTNEEKRLFDMLPYVVPFGGNNIVKCSEAPFIVGYDDTEIPEKISYLKFYDIFTRYSNALLSKSKSLSIDVKVMMEDKMDKAVKEFQELMG